MDPLLQPWDEVTIDLITCLRRLSSLDDSKPRQQVDTTEGLRSLKQNSDLKLRQQPYDWILVMIERLTKYTYFIPCLKSIAA
jgi:hypothetical protein